MTYVALYFTLGMKGRKNSIAGPQNWVKAFIQWHMILIPLHLGFADYQVTLGDVVMVVLIWNLSLENVLEESSGIFLM